MKNNIQLAVVIKKDNIVGEVVLNDSQKSILLNIIHGLLDGNITIAENKNLIMESKNEK